MRNELVSSGLDFTKIGYRLSFYIKMSVLLTGASWRADHVDIYCIDMHLSTLCIIYSHNTLDVCDFCIYRIMNICFYHLYINIIVHIIYVILSEMYLLYLYRIQHVRLQYIF